VIGKVGTDIQDNKCSWVVNEALVRAGPQQRQVLDECYGRKDPQKEGACKRVFEELEIEKAYKAYEERAVGEIRQRIAGVDESQGLRKEVFENFLAKIYGRSK